MLKAKAYWKDIRDSFASSKGRVFSIVALMALGSFALVGLKVVAPDMRLTGDKFFQSHNTADLYVISDYGLDSDDTKILSGIKNDATVEYGYFKDVVIEGKDTAFRIFSKPKKLSTYNVVEGTLPTNPNEIAISAAYQDKYKIGDKISFSEKENTNGKKVLKETTFTITGFVNSSEILSRVNQGASTAGSGELSGYAVVTEETFDSDVYMVARIAYNNLKGISPYSEKYLDNLQDDKSKVQELFKNRAEERFTNIKGNSQKTIDAEKTKISAAKQELEKAKQQLEASQVNVPEGNKQLAEAKQQLESKQAQITEGEKQLAEAQETLNHLSKPSYNIYTRREAPGSEGYVAYENQTKIIDSIANIFPVVLYLIAALVTFTTMGRFVDEERLKVGVLRALGYERKDIIRKFLIYGATCGIVGTIIGTLLGHYLLPMIVYKAYCKDIVIAAIELPFYWKAALYALILSSIATVLPAYIVARQTLTEKPAQLLQPKAPVSGEKIFLERITPLWNRMSFTQKVTARNIFRYKKRMFMTIFGVAGSVAMVFTGLGVHGSIADLSKRQFSQIITYDMIVVDKDYISNEEKKARDNLLNSQIIKQSMPVRYNKVTKVAGNNNDEQSITLLSIDSNQNNQLKDYVHLKDRKSGNNIDIPRNGAIISEKLADLLGDKVGDTIVVKNQSDEDVTLTISDITEMYMNHFIFISDDYYKEIFGETAENNAHLINLVDDSEDNANKVAAEFMNLNSTKGLVQNISLKHQISTIVTSLNNVMLVLVIISTLLAAVILYNLTNINVAERIRELSTIKVLGFHNKEVTMYIYRESIYLSLIGILVGFGGGYLLYRYMLFVIPPDFIMFNPAVKWAVYAFPAGVIVITLFILGLMVNRWLRKVDMLEALKSVE